MVLPFVCEGLGTVTYLPFPTPYVTQVDTYTVAPTTGTTVSVEEAPMRNWTIMVKGTGGVPTAWDVVLEGSLDGTTFSEILNHNTLIGNGENLYSGTTLFPALYFRTRIVTLTLGPASDVVVNVLGQQ